MRVLVTILALAAAPAAVSAGGCRAANPDGPGRAESNAPATAASTSVDVRADPDTVLTSECTRQTMINRNPEAAIDTCSRALDAARALPAERHEERIKAHSNLAEAYILSGRWPDAIREFETALRLEAPLAANSYRGGERLGMMAMAYFKLGDLSSADRYAGRAVSTLKAVTTANEDERRVVTGTLRSMLEMQAGFKRLHGDETGASRLEREAEALDPQAR